MAARRMHCGHEAETSETRCQEKTPKDLNLEQNNGNNILSCACHSKTPTCLLKGFSTAMHSGKMYIHQLFCCGQFIDMVSALN